MENVNCIKAQFMDMELKERLLSTGDYHQMIEAGILGEDDRIELLNGRLVEMAPIGSRHSTIVKRLTKLFYRRLPDEILLGVQDPTTLPDSEPGPDITILHPSANQYADQHPEAKDIYIVIEVSGQTLAKDRNVKLPIYAKAGIPEYWIINLEKDEIEVYSQPSHGKYSLMHLYSKGEKVHVKQFGFEIDSRDLLR